MKFLATILTISLSIPFAFSQNYPVLNLDVPKALENPGKCMLSSVASKVNYVPLEAKPGSFIKNVDRFTISDDLILVADKNAGKVMKFDRAGKYLGDLMVKGKGPKEFSHIEGLDINSRGEILVLKDWDIIDIYSKSGDLIKSFKYFGFASGRWLTDDKIVLAMDYLVSKGKMIVTLDRQGKEVGAGLINSVLPKTNSDPAWTRLMVCPEGYLYWNELFDTVYTVNLNGEVHPRSILHKGINRITKEDMVDGMLNDMIMTNQKNHIRFYSEFNGKIFISAIVRGLSSTIVFDNLTGKGFVDMKTSGLRNDIDKGPYFSTGMVLKDGTAVRFIQQDELNHSLDWEFKRPGLLEPGTYDINLFQKLADYGNPVLMIVK